jgi:hypothetical protein
MTTRRGFIGALLAATAAPRLGWAAAGGPAFLAAARETDDSFSLCGLTADGGETFRIGLPARGHAGAGHPHRAEAVAFARRPGHFALVIDCVRGEVRHHLSPGEGRQFNGHGVYLDQGRVLVTSEQVAEDSRGVIGIWDVEAGYRRVGEVGTGGIGPHDLRLMPDGETLVVANGGIATDPADRTKLNVATMRTNLAFVTLAGGPVEVVEPEADARQNSIRHLAIRGDGLVAFAMQWEGEASAPPLLGLIRRGGGMTLAAAPETEHPLMQGYAGSVAFSGDGMQVAITSPRGGRAQRFGADGTFLDAVSRGDVCGIAPLGQGFLLSDGQGGLLSWQQEGLKPLGLSARAWDNHIVTL